MSEPGMFRWDNLGADTREEISKSMRKLNFEVEVIPAFPEWLKKMVEDNRDYRFVPTVPDPMLDEVDEYDSLIPWPPHPDYKKCYDLYKQHEGTFWVMEEVDMTSDRSDFFKKLTKEGRRFIITVLSFFVSSDTIVADNLARRFMAEVKRWEPKMFFGFQAAIEGIHSETYVMMLRTFIDKDEDLFNMCASIRNHPVIRKKDEWALRWISSDRSFHERLVAFVAVEGIFFSASFCAIGWLKTINLMHGLTYANDKISPDEGLHCKHGYTLLGMLKERLPEWRIQEIIASAVEIEMEYVKSCLPVSLIGMNQGLMCQYVQYVADVVLQWMDCSKIYDVKNPFDWMVNWSVDGLTAFFEKRVAEYQIPHVNRSLSEMDTVTRDDSEQNSLRYDAPF